METKGIKQKRNGNQVVNYEDTTVFIRSQETWNNRLLPSCIKLPVINTRLTGPHSTAQMCVASFQKMKNTGKEQKKGEKQTRGIYMSVV